MLYQIERRLAALQKEMKMQEKDVVKIKASAVGLATPSRVTGSKVVAIDVDPEMYAQLQEVAKKHGVRGVRGALALAARAGLRSLL
jgi:predicted RNA methylase